jgi:hypothetical protein
LGEMNHQKTILDDLIKLPIFKIEEEPFDYIGDDKDEILKQNDHDLIVVNCLECGHSHRFFVFQYKLATTVDVKKRILQCKICDNFDKLDIRIYFDEEKT